MRRDGNALPSSIARDEAKSPPKPHGRQALSPTHASGHSRRTDKDLAKIPGFIGEYNRVDGGVSHGQASILLSLSERRRIRQSPGRRTEALRLRDPVCRSGERQFAKQEQPIGALADISWSPPVHGLAKTAIRAVARRRAPFSKCIILILMIM